MNFLAQTLPEGVVIGSRFYPVHTDFKNWIKIAELLEEEKEHGMENMAEVLLLCYIELPESLFEAMQGVFDFLSGGAFKSFKKGGGIDKQRCFSFKEDGRLIYAAFLSQYGIDLLDEPLHWHKFLALFSALKGEHKLFDVVKIRGMNLSEIKDREKRASIRKLKRIYALSDWKNETEKAEEIADKMAGLF